jgi:hypothetical protein
VAGDHRGNTLTRLLREDPHLAPFVGLAGKENGFDVEGLAVAGDRLFLGLCGPVLRGWAVVLELRPDGDELALRRFDGRKRRRVRKHFPQLGVLGVRDLCLHGDDLLVLAGPTMDLDGPVRVLRWRDAVRHARDARGRPAARGARRAVRRGLRPRRRARAAAGGRRRRAVAARRPRLAGGPAAGRGWRAAGRRVRAARPNVGAPRDAARRVRRQRGTTTIVVALWTTPATTAVAVTT